MVNVIFNFPNPGQAALPPNLTEVTVSVEFLNSVLPEDILNASISLNQLEGSFEVTVIGNVQSSYASKMELIVFRRVTSSEIVEIKGIIREVSLVYGSSGILTRISGTILSKAGKKPFIRTYMSLEKFSYSGWSESDFISNDTSQFASSPNLYFLPSIPPRVQQIIDNIASASGLTVSGTVPIDYRVYKHAVNTNRVMDELEQLCLASGANIMLQHDGNARILDHDKIGQLHEVSIEQISGDLDVRVVVSEFDGVEVTPSSEIAPYNSNFIGSPEKIGTIDLQIGSARINELAEGKGAVDTSDWEIDERIPENRWMKKVIKGTDTDYLKTLIDDIRSYMSDVDIFDGQLWRAKTIQELTQAEADAEALVVD